MRVPGDEDFTSRRGRDATGWADGLRNDGGQESTAPRVYKDNTSWKRVVYRITRNTFPDVPMASSNRQRVAKEDTAWKREYYFKTKGPVPDAPMSSPNRDVELVGRIHDVNTLTDPPAMYEVDHEAAFLSALLEYEKTVGAAIGSQPIRASYHHDYVDSQSLGDDGYDGMDPRPAVPDRPVVDNEQDDEEDERFDDPVVHGDQFEGGIAHSDEEESDYEKLKEVLKEAFRSMKSEFYFIQKS